MARTLIIGFGNTLRSDDGLGWYVAERLASEISHPEIQVLVLQELTAEIADSVRQAERVLFIDAASEGEPGELRCTPVAPSESVAYVHHCSPGEILKLAEDLYGARPIADQFTVTGASFELAQSLSPAVSAVVPALLAKIREWVATAVR
ncbi:MAG TPA: hydrogenase maturation protease [Terriglobales bacterium]|nr:hydrogenase maturation protease [Terriglobales bacterium]